MRPTSLWCWPNRARTTSFTARRATTPPTRKEPTAAPPPDDCRQADTPALEQVATPDARTIEEVAAFLAVDASRLLKTLIYVADGQPVAAVVRGDDDLNEIEIAAGFGCDDVGNGLA